MSKSDKHLTAYCGFNTILFTPLGHDITDEEYRVVQN